MKGLFKTLVSNPRQLALLAINRALEFHGASQVNISLDLLKFDSGYLITFDKNARERRGIINKCHIYIHFISNFYYKLRKSLLSILLTDLLVNISRTFLRGAHISKLLIHAFVFF